MVGLKAFPPCKVLELAHHLASLSQAHHFNVLVGLQSPKAVSTVIK